MFEPHPSLLTKPMKTYPPNGTGSQTATKKGDAMWSRERLFLIIWAISTVCLEVLLIATLLHPHWIDNSSRTLPPAPTSVSRLPAGQVGLYSYCVEHQEDESASSLARCVGSLFDFGQVPLTAGAASGQEATLGQDSQQPSILPVCAAFHLGAATTVGIACLLLIGLTCTPRPARLLTVASGGLLMGGLCLAVVVIGYPVGWSWHPVRKICGPLSGPYQLGACRLSPAFLILIVATPDAILLGVLALLLARRMEGGMVGAGTSGFLLPGSAGHSGKLVDEMVTLRVPLFAASMEPIHGGCTETPTTITTASLAPTLPLRTPSQMM